MWLAVTRALEEGIFEPETLYTYEEYVKSLYPVAYWRLGDSTLPTAIDELGNYDGTYTNSPTLSEPSLLVGDNNSSALFNGTTQYVTASNISELTNDATVIASIKTTNLGNTNTIWEQYDSVADAGCVLFINSSGYASFDGRSGGDAYYYSGDSTSICTDGSIKHIVGVRDGSVWKIYIDGILENSTDSLSSGSISNAVSNNIGKIGEFNSNFFDGTIDDVAVLNRALTQTEVTNLYNLSKAKKVNKPLYYDYAQSLEPVAYWRLGETSGGTAYDLSGNNNHGTYTNSPTLGATGLLTNNTDTAVTFNGTDESMQLDSTTITELKTHTTGTISFLCSFPTGERSGFWMAQDTTNNDDFIVEAFESGVQYVFKTGNAAAGVDNFYIRTDMNLSINTTYHIVCVQDDTEGALIYVDGILRPTTTMNGTPNSKWINDATNLDTANINRYDRDTDTWYAGTVDEFMIFDKKLTKEEIENLYLKSQGLPTTPITYEHTVRSLMPIAYWKLDEVTTATEAVDELGNYDGTYVNAPNLDSDSLIVDDSGTSVTLNGTDEYITKTISNFRSSDSQGTIVLSLNSTNKSSNNTLFASSDYGSSNYRFIFYTRTDGTLTVYQRNNDTPDQILGSIDVCDGNDHLCILTSNGSVYKMYVDGIEDTSLTVNSGSNSGDWLDSVINRDYITIGAEQWNSSTTNLTNGIVDEVAYYDYALTQSQITNLYNASRSSNYLLTIDSSKVAEDLYNFPMLINLDTNSGISGSTLDTTSVFKSLDDNVSVNEPIKLKLEYLSTNFNKPNIVDDNFSGADSSIYDSILWKIYEDSDVTYNSKTIDIQGNKLNNAFDITDSGNIVRYGLESNFKLSGDFDFEISVSDMTTDTRATYSMLTITEIGGFTGPLSFSTNNWSSNYGGSGTQSVARTNNFGKLRYVRSGSTVTAYVKDGNASSWTQINSVAALTTVDTSIRFYLYMDSLSGDSSPFVRSCKWDNFKLNSGTIVWPNYDNITNKLTQDCKVEIDRWDSTNKQAQLWVKVPYISKDADTVLRLIADPSNPDNSVNVGYTGDTAAQSVWSEYDAVYHMSSVYNMDWLDAIPLYDTQVTGANSTTSYANATFTAINTAGVIADDYIQLAIHYSQDPSNISNGQIEISSSTSVDTDELYWNIQAGGDIQNTGIQLVAGWQVITLKLSDAFAIGSIDLNSLVRVRAYTNSSISAICAIQFFRYLKKTTSWERQLRCNGLAYWYPQLRLP